MQEESGVVSSRFTFRGMEYIVSMWVTDENLLTVEVEDRLTADQWRGSFDPEYVEDLTHKTGNYKQFTIFVSMLDSALTQSTDSVTLDLLTYNDLESLRNRKAGLGSRTIPGAQKAALNTKRYLILTYTVEFDRIHYPLPLPYQGKPDPVALQDTVRELRKEIKHLKSQLNSDFKSTELLKLTKDYEILLREKQELEDAFLRNRRELKNTSMGTAAKEVRILKTAIRNLEEELMSERRKYQRSSSKRNQNYKEFVEEVEELRASERNLKVRVKSLTNELSMLKRNSSKRTSRSPVITTPASQQSNRTAARRPPSVNIARSRPSSRIESSSRVRSLPKDRGRGRRSSISSVGSRSRSVSPAGARVPRFDPTAYIIEKKRRAEEARLKGAREQRSGGHSGRKSRSTNTQERGRPRRRVSGGYRGFRSRSSSAGSAGSRRSSTGGVSDVDVLSDTSEGRRRRLHEVQNPEKASSSSAWASPGVLFTRKAETAGTKRLMSTPDPDYQFHRAAAGKARGRTFTEYNGQGMMNHSTDCNNHASEMSEIDARLGALQQFMKHNL